MRRKISLAWLAFSVSAAVGAAVVTQKYDWKPVSGAQDVHVEVDRVVVSQLRFDLGDTLGPLRASSARAVARVDNNGWVNQEVGVAIAIFDGDGNLVAAGSGGVKVGYLSKGERDTFTIRFPYVYRNLEKAKTFIVTLETKERAPAKGKESATPKPSPPGD